MDKQVLLRLVGNKIRDLRLERGLTQSDLAKRCLKDKQSIERVENGKTNPTVFYLSELAKVLKIPLKDLLDI